MVRESAKTNSKTVAKDAECIRRRQIEESWNQIKPRVLPPRFDHAANEWLKGLKPHLAVRTYAIYEVALRCHLNIALRHRRGADCLLPSGAQI
jgi:hypothetical protein